MKKLSLAALLLIPLGACSSSPTSLATQRIHPASAVHDGVPVDCTKYALAGDRNCPPPPTP
jgi:hypothetical protein